MQKELLVPAGSLETLEYAIKAGADAIYIGGKKFGARAYAKNFTENEIITAKKMCHLYGVKLYVTVNTMLKEDIFTSVKDYIKFLYANNIDALIVSDLGLISYIHENYPKFPVHVSTQAHTFCDDEVTFLKKLGVTRVVLDREMSLEEIAKIKSIEKEVFVHGALCSSYSGQCLISALKFGRSGNLGSCAQNCRMAYQLIRNNKVITDYGKYLLSTKELNTTQNFKELLDSDISSFKIEGRMKSKEYVYYVTKIYKKLIEDYNQYKTCTIKKEDTEILKNLFYRGFTNGYLFKEQNIYETKTSNHQGSLLGKVISFHKNKIGIKLVDSLYQEDAIRFTIDNTGMYVNFLYDKNGKFISHGKAGEVVFVKNTNQSLVGSEVRKTINSRLIKDLENINLPKVGINFLFKANKKSVSLTINDNKNSITKSLKGEFTANKRITTKEEIKSKLLKLGNSPFIVINTNIDIEDNLFIPMSLVNELRRETVNRLIEKRSV